MPSVQANRVKKEGVSQMITFDYMMRWGGVPNKPKSVYVIFDQPLTLLKDSGLTLSQQ